MSSYSFSHQFYQRWTRAPEFIRSAITQELADIATLLQPETNLKDYQFSIEDLDAHLDDLILKHDAYLKAEAERQALAEKQRLIEQEKQDREERRRKREEAERLAIDKAAKDKQRREEEKAYAEQAAIDEAKAKNEQQDKPQILPVKTDDSPDDLTIEDTPAESSAATTEESTAEKTNNLSEEKSDQQTLADDVDALFEDIRSQNDAADLQDSAIEKDRQPEQNLTPQDDSSNDKAEQEPADNISAKNADSNNAEHLAIENDSVEQKADKKETAEQEASVNETAENKDTTPAKENDDKPELKAQPNKAENNISKEQKDVPKSLSLNAATVDDLTQALSNHLDDFLTDKMMQLSDDLKAWLKDEISRQLAELDAKNKQD